MGRAGRQGIGRGLGHIIITGNFDFKRIETLLIGNDVTVKDIKPEISLNFLLNMIELGDHPVVNRVLTQSRFQNKNENNKVAMATHIKNGLHFLGMLGKGYF